MESNRKVALAIGPTLTLFHISVERSMALTPSRLGHKARIRFETVLNVAKSPNLRLGQQGIRLPHGSWSKALNWKTPHP
jgi:hypothetical protein